MDYRKLIHKLLEQVGEEDLKVIYEFILQFV